MLALGNARAAARRATASDTAATSAGVAP